MTRAILIFVAGIVTFGIGVQQFLRLQTDSRSHPPSAGAAARPTNQNKPTASATATDHRVAITVDGLNFTFAPATVTVRVGDTITWVNKTASPHTVTSVQPKLFDVSIAGHGAARLAFHRSGTYQYYCALHPYMLGVIKILR